MGRTVTTAKCDLFYTDKPPFLPVAEALPRVVRDSHRGMIYEFAMDRSSPLELSTYQQVETIDNADTKP